VAGALVPGREEDILLVGTDTNVMAYDVERNADVFYKASECPGRRGVYRQTTHAYRRYDGCL
jgi:hypothetical protein